MNEKQFHLKNERTGLYFTNEGGGCGFTAETPATARTFTGSTDDALRAMHLFFGPNVVQDVSVELKVSTVPANVKQDVNRFCKELDQLIEEHNRKNGYKCKTRAEWRETKKYLRVARVDTWGGNGIWFIVDKETGDIYKPKSYIGGPANKIVRGNVSRPASDFWNRTITPYGLASAK